MRQYRITAIYFLTAFPTHSRVRAEERAGKRGHGALAKEAVEPLEEFSSRRASFH